MLIGRGTLLAQIHKAAATEGATFDLRGSSGSGKTTLVRHLDEEAMSLRRILVDMEEFDPGHRRDNGLSASVGAVQGSFRQFRRLLLELAARAFPDDVAERFRLEVMEAYDAEVTGRRVFSLEQAMVETRGELTPKDLADAWRASAAAIAERFVGHWNGDGDMRRLLLLDNVDEVSDQELGVWLAALLPRLRRTTVVLTRQPGALVPGVPDSAGVVALDVPDFDEGEVGEYLEHMTHGRVPPDLVAKVHRITGGHAGTVAVVHDLLWGSGLGANAYPEKVLRDLPDEASERVALLVERLVERLGDAAMSNALLAAAVPRRFDSDLLKALLVGADHGGDDVKRVFEAFGRFPFVEDVTPAGSALPVNSVLRIHPYVRTGLLDRMLRLGKDRFYALHEAAAEHHTRGMVGGAYGEAFVYEHPAWQRSKREWLYHRGHALRDEARHSAVLEFSRVFFEAFWWWGNYVHFDFCDQLIADLGYLARQHGVGGEGSSWADIQVLHDAAESFLRAYPPRSGKRKDAAWDLVYDALLAIQDLCGLADRRRVKTDDERKVAALLDVFLAHTWRYRAPHAPQGDEYYERAASGFEALDEDWSAAWVNFERAELCLEAGQAGDTLRALWLSAAEIVQPRAAADDEEEAPKEDADAPDEELAANLHRLRGDLCWLTGDHDRAAQWYRRAVLHAYLFHVVGGPPDEYTLQFYVDVRARALNRLRELWSRGLRDDALRCASALAGVRAETSFDEKPAERDALEALLDEGDPLELARALFPRGPQVSELGRKTSPFMKEHRRRREALDGEAAALDLHDLAWP